MKRFRELIFRFGGLFNKQRKDQELDQEIESHLQMHIEDNFRLGMTPEEARREALIKLGGVESTKEAYRDQRGLPVLETLWQDIRYGARMLRKKPGFTAVAALSLALGLGVNTMMFSFFNAYLLRPVPLIKEPRRIVEINRGDSLNHRSAFSFSEYERFRDHNDVLSGLVAYTAPQGGTLMLGSDTRPADRTEIRAKLVSGNYFSVLGVEAALGRTFLPEETQTPGSHPVVVLSHSLWQRCFAADPNLIGKTVQLNGSAFTVVGIAPRNFAGLGSQMLVTDAWLPLQMLAEVDRDVDWPRLQKEFRFQLAGRLKPGIRFEQAASALRVVHAQIAEPDPDPNTKIWLGLNDGCTLMSLADNLEVMLPIMAAMGLVLLIACANVASLSLAHTMDRRKEISVRLALGAGRGRVVRQLLTESVLIAGLGAACGLLLGHWSGTFAWSLRGSFLPPDVPLVDLNFSPDWRVVAYTLLLSLLTGLVFGLAPAIEASRASLASALKKEDVWFGQRIAQSRLHNLFAMAQIAVCLSLLIGAGLLLRAGQKAASVDFSYETEKVILAHFDLRRHGYDPVRTAEFHRQLLERVKGLPGVKSVSLALHTFAGRNHVDAVSAGYFETMRLPILRGRSFTEEDGRNGMSVAIVSQATAERLWPSQNPIGQRMTNAPFAEIVGVARNARNLFECLVNNARPSAALPNAALDDYLYFPLSSADPNLPEMRLLARTEGDPRALTAALSEEVRALDPKLAISVGPLTQELEGGLKLFRGLAGLANVLGLVALWLATMGIYGVMAYAVSQRTQEIGIRMALGAQKWDVLQSVLRRGGAVIAWGLVLGLPGSLALSGYLSSLLVGLSSWEPTTFACVSLFLSLIALGACYLPARRATKVDPMEALRCE